MFWTIRVIPLLKKRHLFVIFSMLCLKSFTSKTLFTKKSLFISMVFSFFFKKPKNTLQSNRLSRQKGLPTLSMARSTLKIHENFLFWTFWKIEYREKFCEDTKKNISVEKFLFSLRGRRMGKKHRRTKNDKDSAFYEYTEPSKEKTPSFCGQKKRQGSPLLFLHLYKTSFIF